MPLFILFILLIFVSASLSIPFDKVLQSFFYHPEFNFAETEYGKKRLEYGKKVHDEKAVIIRQYLIQQQRCHAQDNTYTHLGTQYTLDYKWNNMKKSCSVTTTTVDENGFKESHTRVSYTVSELPDYRL